MRTRRSAQIVFTSSLNSRCGMDFIFSFWLFFLWSGREPESFAHHRLLLRRERLAFDFSIFLFRVVGMAVVQVVLDRWPIFVFHERNELRLRHIIQDEIA